ncbi:MAG TPA: hypothetical protein VMU54_25310 [Planctomycetota bacterium]|nr:hypothetical protein [Planctomycetota bacterium]
MNADPELGTLTLMPIISYALVIEPQSDAEIEKALVNLGVEVRFARGNEALRASSTLLPSAIILDAGYPELDSWRLMAELWNDAKQRPHPPALILLTGDVDQWGATRLGPVRISDRRHLREVFGDALNATLNGAGLELADEGVWGAAVERVKMEGNQRFKAEEDRLRRRGILDERGELTSDEWPADMKPGSKTDVAT